VIASVLLALALTAKPVFTGSAVTLLGGPSPDGRFVSMVEHGDLTVREVATNRSLQLTHASGKEFAYFSAFSRDGKTIAYAWFNQEGYYELRSIPAAGGKPVTLFKNPEAGFVQPCAWTPDHRWILTLLFRKDNVSQIALIAAAGDAPPRVLRSLNWVYPKRMDLSPDGTRVVYDSFAPGSNTQRTIYLLNVDGSGERQLVTTPGNYLFPLFSPDGGSVYYLGDAGLFRLVVREDAVPRLLHPGLGRALLLGVTKQGTLYYGVRAGISDLFLAEAADPAGTARPLPTRFPGRNLAPSYSPDGGKLAYLSRRGTENFGREARTAVVQDLASKDETEIQARMAHIERVNWRHDGRALLLSGSDGRGRGGLFEYDLATRRTRPLAAEIGGPPEGFESVSVERGIYYRDGNRVRSLDGGIVHEGRNLKAMAALADGQIAVYDENAVVLLESARRFIVSDLGELAGGAAHFFARRGGKLVQVSPAKEWQMPEGLLPGIAISPNGSRIAFSTGGESRQIWSIELP
jgi:Tol biopolymer transport system component